MEVAKIDYRSNQAGIEFEKSLQTTGFAVLTHHPISQELIQQVYLDWEKFFSSPSKFDYLFKPCSQSGYFPFKSENSKYSQIKDLKEFYHLFTNTPLPDGLGDSTLQLRKQLTSLAVTLLEWLEIHCPPKIRAKFSVPLTQMIEKSDKTLLRILHYPPISEDSPTGAIRSAPHEDINLITLLPAATAPGLQVQDKEGLWHDVSCDVGDLVINAGDMLELASQHYFKSTSHQVVNPTGPEAFRSRYSMPLFLHPRGEVFLSKNRTAQDYLDQRLAEIGLKELPRPSEQQA